MPFHRRDFLKSSAALASASLIAPHLLGQQQSQTGALQGGVESGKVKFSPISGAGQKRESGPPDALPPEKRVGYAIVGLGRLALEEVLPAFGECKRSKPVALVSGHREKAQIVAQQYGLDAKNIYSYDNYDEIAQNPTIQVVYVILPNSMHADFTVRAAKAGKHVFSEKPMATSSQDCQRMIDACHQAQRKLGIAYRSQYEPKDMRIVEMARSGAIGKLKNFLSTNSQQQGDPNQWRLKRALSGGGCLPDVGIYCLNAARFISGEEPAEVIGHTWSTPGDPRFREVEELCQFTLRFPSGFHANCTCSYGIHKSQMFRLEGDQGWIELNPAYAYRGLHMKYAKLEGKEDAQVEPQIEDKNQFALEMDAFSDCVLNNTQPKTPGEEGLKDQRIIETIYESARTGRPVTLKS